MGLLLDRPFKKKRSTHTCLGSINPVHCCHKPNSDLFKTLTLVRSSLPSNKALIASWMDNE
jgi:hypothetical protein